MPERNAEPKTAEQLTEQNVATIIQLDQAARANCRPSERAAQKITDLFGSVGFAIANAAVFAVWISANLLLPDPYRFDPFPFQLLTLLVSLEAIFLSVFVLIAQRLQARLNERRAHLDLQINLLAEQESTRMLQLLRDIGKKLGVSMRNHSDVKVLSEQTAPEVVARQIDQSIAKNESGSAGGPDRQRAT